MFKWLRKKKVDPLPAYSFDELSGAVMETFHEILRREIYQYGLTEEEIYHRIEYKKNLRRSLKNCALGDRFAKIYIMDCIKDFLQKKYFVTDETIDSILPFHQSRYLDAEMKFSILLYTYEKQYKARGLEVLLEEYQLAQPRQKEHGECFYEITSEEIHDIYDSWEQVYLTFNDKLNLLSMKLYEKYLGNGVIDMLCSMDVDGISAGVSGVSEDYIRQLSEEDIKPPASYDSIWILYKGISIRL